ncbi:MAG: phenylalanine--tRNA ligase subunit beta, partial [Candidatus Uhrbacteria bacterium]
PLSVSVSDSMLCPRYRAVALDGIVVAPSPAWLRARLSSCGIRSINNVVDVTNFVLLELGQPMHAFDADKIGSDSIGIVVRSATKGEKVACLDDATYSVGEDDLLITDGKNPIAIAGVMGGKESAVTNATTRIVFESANFSPVSVRKTSTKLALRSESSARFEKSLDPAQCEATLDRAVALLVELCPTARVVSNVVDEYPNPPKPVVVDLSPAQVSGLLGVEILADDIVDILGRLGFEIPHSRPDPNAPLSITIPSWRATKDVSIKEDVIEEVARIYGYDRIPSSLPTFSIATPPQDPVRLFARAMRKTLSVGLSSTEVYRYAYVSPETITKLGFVAANHVKLANPLAADRPYLAQSLLPNLFETVADNHRSAPTVSVFEIDRVFFGVGEDEQPYHLAMAYSAAGDEKPFATARENVRVLLSSAGLDVSFGPVTNQGSWMHPGRSADILVNGKKFGIVAESSPEAAQSLGIDRRVAVAEMNLSMLADLVATPKTFSPVPTFPSATRDLAFVVADRVAYGDIESALRSASKLLVSVELFDVYRGKGVEDGKKSVAVHLSFASPDRTLSSEEADREVAAIVAVLTKQFDATMRA